MNHDKHELCHKHVVVAEDYINGVLSEKEHIP